jgi:hypothetical protein
MMQVPAVRTGAPERPGCEQASGTAAKQRSEVIMASRIPPVRPARRGASFPRPGR